MFREGETAPMVSIKQYFLTDGSLISAVLDDEEGGHEAFININPGSDPYESNFVNVKDAAAFGITPNNLVMVNAFIELSLGTLLLVGLYTRIASLILAINLFVITSSFGFNDIGVRDFGLAVSTLVIFLNGIDEFGLDRILRKKQLDNEI